MSKAIKIRRGLNIRLQGEAAKSYKEVPQSDTFAIKPPDFHGLVPKMLVKAGAEVKAGTPIFQDKYDDRIVFTSPVSGEVTDIVRGEKRRILEVRILADKETRYESFAAADPMQLSREEVQESMLTSGVWPLMRQRPFACIANPSDTPKAIYVSCTDTHPLAPDNDFIIEGKREEFQIGINALSRLVDGPVQLTMAANGIEKNDAFIEADNAVMTGFTGPHPAGNVGVHIHHIDPINKGEVVWYLYPQDVVAIGRLFRDGKYDASRVIALTGSEVTDSGYVETKIGANIKNMIADNISSDNVRYVSGNALTGTRIDEDGYVGYYDTQLTVLPEGNFYKFFLTDGWQAPVGLSKFSNSKTYPFHQLVDDDYKWRLDTNLNGEERAFVVTGQYEEVFPFDIFPQQLVKACITNDIDKMEQLGIYEIDTEDFALCEFVCTSKINSQSIVRAGLDLVKQECT